MKIPSFISQVFCAAVVLSALAASGTTACSSETTTANAGDSGGGSTAGSSAGSTSGSTSGSKVVDLCPGFTKDHAEAFLGAGVEGPTAGKNSCTWKSTVAAAFVQVTITFAPTNADSFKKNCDLLNATPVTGAGKSACSSFQATGGGSLLVTVDDNATLIVYSAKGTEAQAIALANSVIAKLP